MTIWLIFFSNFHGDDEFVGAYSTEEAARAKVGMYVRHEQGSMTITKYELDSD